MDLHQVSPNKAEWVGHLAADLTAAISSQWAVSTRLFRNALLVHRLSQQMYVLVGKSS